MVSSQLSELSLNSSTWMFKAGHSVVVSFIYEFVASFYHSSTQKTSQVGCLCGPWICPWFSPATLASTDASTRKPSQQSSLAYRLILKKKNPFSVLHPGWSNLFFDPPEKVCIVYSIVIFWYCAFSSFITVNGLEAEFMLYLCFIPCNSRQVTLCRVNSRHYALNESSCKTLGQ